jgi:hypothetical protein
MEPNVEVIGATLKVVVKTRKKIVVEAPREVHDNTLIAWEFVTEVSPAPQAMYVKPLETVALEPHEDCAWDPDRGMPWEEGNLPRAFCHHKSSDQDETETEYLVTVEFGGGDLPKTVIGSIIIVEP